MLQEAANLFINLQNLCYRTFVSAIAAIFCSLDKWVANPTTHVHCNKLYANSLSGCNCTVGKIYFTTAGLADMKLYFVSHSSDYRKYTLPDFDRFSNDLGDQVP